MTALFSCPKQVIYTSPSTSSSVLFGTPITLHQRGLLMVGISQNQLLKQKKELEIMKDQPLNSKLKNYREEERFRMQNVTGCNTKPYQQSPTRRSRCTYTNQFTGLSIYDFYSYHRLVTPNHHPTITSLEEHRTRR